MNLLEVAGCARDLEKVDFTPWYTLTNQRAELQPSTETNIAREQFCALFSIYAQRIPLEGRNFDRFRILGQLFEQEFGHRGIVSEVERRSRYDPANVRLRARHWDGKLGSIWLTQNRPGRHIFDTSGSRAKIDRLQGGAFNRALCWRRCQVDGCGTRILRQNRWRQKNG